MVYPLIRELASSFFCHISHHKTGHSMGDLRVMDKMDIMDKQLNLITLLFTDFCTMRSALRLLPELAGLALIQTIRNEAVNLFRFLAVMQLRDQIGLVQRTCKALHNIELCFGIRDGCK